MSKGRIRQKAVRARAEKRRWAKRTVAAALIAGAGAVGFGANHASAGETSLEAAGFTLGPTSFLGFDFNDLIEDILIDIDGDGQDDFKFQYGDGIGEFNGIEIMPLLNDGIQNEVFQYGGDVIYYPTPQDLLNGIENDMSSGDTANIVFDFSYGGFIGFKFDIPDGSPYIGAVEFETTSFAYGTIIHTGYQRVPEPTGLALLSMAALAYGSRRARRNSEKRRA